MASPRTSISSSSNVGILPSSSGGRRVAVIFDASRELSMTTIWWTMQQIVQPHDVLTILGIFHQIVTPMGYKAKADLTSFNGVNSKFIEDEVTKQTVYYTSKLKEIQSACEKQDVELHVGITTGQSLAIATVQEARQLEASWVVLDRSLKRHKRYISEQLRCNLMMMDQNTGQIVKLIEPVVLGPALQLRDLSYDSASQLLTQESSDTESVTGKCKEAFELLSTLTEISTVLETISAKEVPAADLPSSAIADAGGSHARPLCSVCKYKSPDNFLDEGGFGAVYRGLLDGQHVAVKTHKLASDQGAKEFLAEVEILGHARHRNVVTLLGYVQLSVARVPHQRSSERQSRCLLLRCGPPGAHHGTQGDRPVASLLQQARHKLDTGNAEALLDPRLLASSILDDSTNMYEVYAMIHAAAFCLRRDPWKCVQILRILEG